MDSIDSNRLYKKNATTLLISECSDSDEDYKKIVHKFESDKQKDGKIF